MEVTLISQFESIRSNATGSKEDGLVQHAQNGDMEAFNQLVMMYQDWIFSHAAWILGDEDSAADITQITFLDAYHNLPRFRSGSFRSWLYRIVTNNCYDELRRRKRHPIQSIEDADGEEEGSLPTYDLQSSNISPEKSYERREIQQSIQKALNQLDPDQRAVIVMVDLQDMDYQEAAEILGVPLGTLKSRVSRARLQLRNLLKPLKEYERIG